MDCKYFGKCASCVLHDMNYEEQLNHKIKREKERFSDLTTMEFDIIKSEEEHFRNRAEFRIWKNFDNEDNLTLSYAMNGYDKNVVEINECKIVSSHISDVMPKLLDKIQNDQTLSFKIFSIEFLGSTIDDLLVTMIYHRKLDSTWIEKAKELEKELNIKIIGRSRKQKEILSVDYINEELEIDGRKYQND
jgi:tRNA (uracil-5-)-methyltransferase